MGYTPLLGRLKTPGFELIIVVLCLSASIIWAGFVFFGGSLGSRTRQVTLVAFGTAEGYFTDARTVGDFLTEVGIVFTPDDRVEPPPETWVIPGMVVSYVRSVRVFLADAGGSAEAVMCAGGTVCDLLEEAGVSIGPLDRVVPPPSTPLEPDMRVEVTRVQVLDATREREIPPPLILEADPEVPRGRVEEVDPGSPGVAEDITRVWYRNGEETLRVDLDSRILLEPRQRVARVGTRSLPPLASRGGSLDRGILSMVATGYDPGPASCWPYADGFTATGHRAGRGVCAVDPRVIPLGTQLWVEGYGYVLACDTGGAIKGDRIDLCFDTRSEAIQWGRRTVLVYILE